MRYMALFFALALWTSASAQELSLVGHGVSFHLKNSENYNESNWGLGIRLDLPSVAIQAGSYENSYSRRSNYIVLDLQLINQELGPTSRLEFGPMLGLASGYPGHNVVLIPGLRSSIYYGNMYLTARVFPSYNAIMVGALEIGYVVYRF